VDDREARGLCARSIVERTITASLGTDARFLTKERSILISSIGQALEVDERGVAGGRSRRSRAPTPHRVPAR